MSNVSISIHDIFQVFEKSYVDKEMSNFITIVKILLSQDFFIYYGKAIIYMCMCYTKAFILILDLMSVFRGQMWL